MFLSVRLPRSLAYTHTTHTFTLLALSAAPQKPEVTCGISMVSL